MGIAMTKISTALQAVRAVFEMYGVNLTPVNTLEAEIARLEGRIEVIREGMQRQQAATEARAEAAEAKIARLTTDNECLVIERNAADERVARLREGLRRIRGWDCLNPPRADLLADLPWLAREIDVLLAEDGVKVCPCGHHADQHPIVWTIAGDATTRCQAPGCNCLDYDGPDLDTSEDGAAHEAPLGSDDMYPESAA